jgi:hypothetical protein
MNREKRSDSEGKKERKKERTKERKTERKTERKNPASYLLMWRSRLMLLEQYLLSSQTHKPHKNPTT